MVVSIITVDWHRFFYANQGKILGAFTPMKRLDRNIRETPRQAKIALGTAGHLSAKLPVFDHRSAEEKYLIQRAAKTGCLIRTLWRGAPKARKEPSFLELLVKLGWNNETKNCRGRASTRIWRNDQIADYLGLSFSPGTTRLEREDKLATKMSDTFNSFTKQRAMRLIRADTGITHYRNSLRPETLALVSRNADRIAPLFAEVAATRKWNEQKVRRLVAEVSNFGQIRGTPLLNGMTPTMACLAGGIHGFPILNAKTRNSDALSAKSDSERAIQLFRMIGRRRIKNAFELDVYVTAFLKRHEGHSAQQKRRWKQRGIA